MSFNISSSKNPLPFNLPTTAKDLEDLYDIDIKAQNAFIAGKSWVEKEHPLGDSPTKVDLKLLALLAGDSFINGSPLNGYPQELSLSYFHDFLGTLKQKHVENPEKFSFLNPAKKSLKYLEDEFGHALRISQDISKIRGAVSAGAGDEERAQLVRQYAEELRREFQGKRVGWVPFGWVTKNGESHAMLARIDMDSGSVTLVNTGGGVENHPGIKCVVKDKLSGKLKEEYKVQQFLEINKVDKKRLEHIDFFRLIVELQTVGTWKGLLEIDEKNIYETIPTYLNGKTAPAVDPYAHPEVFKKPQRSGTCAIKCNSSMMYSVMSGILDGDYSQSQERINCFKTIRFLWQSQALVNYAKNNLNDGDSLEAADAALVKDILENLGRGADKLYKDNLLTKADLEEIQATFMDIEKRLEKMKVVKASNENSIPVCCDVKVGIVNDFAEVEAPVRIEGDVAFWDPAVKGVKVESKEEEFIDFIEGALAEELHIEADEKAFEKIKEVHAQIKFVYERVIIHHGNTYKDKELREIAIKQLLNKFAQLISQIPDPAREGSFWDKIPLERAREYMNEFYSLQVLLQNINYLSGELKHDADVTAMNYFLFAINVKLAHRLPETQLNGFKVNYYDLIYEMKSPSFIIKDPRIQKKLQNALIYFDPKFKLEQLVENGKLSLEKESKRLFAFKEFQEQGTTIGRIDVKESKIQENETIQYYKNFIEKKEIRDELYKRGEITVWEIEKTLDGATRYENRKRGLSQEDSILQHVEALFNPPTHGKPFLPESVSILQNSAILNLVHHYGDYYDSNIPKLSEKDFNTQASVNLASVNLEEITVSVRCKTNINFIDSSDTDIEDGLLKKNTPNNFPDTDQVKIEQDQRNLTKQNTYVVRQENIFGLNIDDSRELQMIGVDPYGTVARALSFAKRHVFLLKEKAFQELLTQHFFNYGRLLSQLQDQPAIVSKIGEFFIEAIKHYQQEADLETCLFLANLGNDLKTFIASEGYKDTMPNFREILRNDLLSQFGEEWSDKRAIFETLMCFYKKTETVALKEKILLSQLSEDLIGLKIAKRMTGSGKRTQNTYEADLIQKRFQSAVEANFEFLSQTDADKGLFDYKTILNKLVKLVVPSSQDDFDWLKFGTVYKNKNYTVDIESGVVTDNKQGKIEVLPQKILDNEIFKKIFKDQVESCGVQSLYDKRNLKVGEIYTVKGASGELVVRANDDFSVVSFEKGKYRYLVDCETLAQKFPTLVDPELEIWVCEEDPAHLIALKGEEEVFRAQLETPAFPVGSVGQTFTITQITKTDVQKRILEWAPVTSMHKSFKFLKKIESSPAHIECWVTKDTKELAEVNCPRLGLTFTVSESGLDKRLVCQKYPGYYLIKNHDLPLFSSLPYLTLENSEGKRKILLPQAPLETEFKRGSLARTISQPINLNNPLSWVEFEIDEGELRAGSMEAKIFHVYLLAANGDYEKAFELLNKITSLSRIKDSKDGKEKTRTMINWLGDMLFKDSHPAAQAMFLHLVAKVEENRLKYPLPMGQEDTSVIPFESILKAYISYTNNHSNIPYYQLNEKQEKFIIDLMEKDINEKEEKLLYDASNIFERFMIRMVTNNEKSALMGRRVTYVKSGKTELGIDLTVREKTNLEELIKNLLDRKPETKGQSLKQTFSNYGFDRELKIDGEIFSSLIQDKYFFEINFAVLYHIAIKGSDAHREALMRMFEINCCLKSDKIRILKNVCNSPESYPTFEKMEQLQEEQRLAEMKLAEAQEVYDRADEAYRRFGYNSDSDEWKQAEANRYIARDQKDRAQEGLSKVKQKNIDLYDKITEKENFIITLIKTICQIAEGIFFGEFSFFTLIKGQIINILRKTVAKGEEAIGERTALRCDGQVGVLKGADDAFDTYFSEMVEAYFKCETKNIVKEWEGADAEKYILPTDHSNEIIKKKLDEENKDLAEHRKTLKTEIKVYQLAPTMSLDNLKGELTTTSDTLEEQLKTQKVALLWQVNQIPEKTDEKESKAIHKLGQHLQLTWEDLRKLTLQGNIEAFQQKTHLSQTEIERIMLGVSDYLIKSTRLEQIKTVNKAIDKVLENDKKVYQKNKDKVRMEEMLIQNVVASLQVIREYTPSVENMHRQWFEVASHYHYRKIQLQKVDKILGTKKREVLAEMPTGFGKTKAMAPTLNYEKALEGWLVINTWPGSLEMTNTVDVKDSMENSFGRKVDRFTFDRSSHISAQTLQLLYDTMMDDKKEGVSINIRSETLRSLQLHYLLYLKMLAKSDLPSDLRDGLKEQTGILIKILREIRTSAWTTIDESHVTLDPMDKLIYTVGDPITMSDAQVEILQEIFEVLTDEPMNSTVKIRDNQQNMLKDNDKEKTFENVIAPYLAEHFRVKKFKIEDAKKESYDNFVLGKTNDIPEWLKDHPQKKQIALVKGELTQILKSSLKGSVDENYGLSKLHIKKKEYAISYASSNTPKENESNPSQFKNAHETMNKTYMTYLHKGLQSDQVQQLIDLLQEQVDDQKKEGISIENTFANKLFKEILAEEKQRLMSLTPEEIDQLKPSERKIVKSILKQDLDKILLLSLKGKDINNLSYLIANSRKAIFHYVRYRIVNQLKIYPDVLASNVHNFRSQFGSSLSLSATPQSAVAHGPDTKFVPMVGTSGQVNHILLTKCSNPNTLHMIDAMKPAEILDKTLDIVEKDSKIHAMIDIGALYKGLSNKDVADKMRDKFKDNNDVQGIMYFDETDGLFKIMEMKTGKVMDPAAVEMDPEVRQTFYDQNRCFGSDLTQAIDAVGVLLTGKGTTKAEAGQAAGRMRQLTKEQSVQIAYQKELKEEIFGDEEATIKKLLIYWIANQAKVEADKNYQSQLQQMDNEIRTPLIDKTLGLKIGDLDEPFAEEPDVDYAVKIFKEVQEEFFTTESSDPWEMYASIPEDKDTKLCLKEAYDAFKARVDGLGALSSSEKENIRTRLDLYPPKWAAMALPEKVRAVNATVGMECEVLQEQDQEIENEVELQVQTTLLERKPKSWDENLDLFGSDWLQPDKIALFLNGISQRLSSLTSWVPKGDRVWIKPVAVIGIGIALGGFVAGVATIVALATPIINAIGFAVAAAFIFVGFAPHLINFVTKGAMVHRVKDLMSYHLPRQVSAASQFFSPNLMVSENFYVQRPNSVGEDTQKPFNIEQKPLFDIVVIQDENVGGGKNVRAILVDQNDSVYFSRKLKEDKENADPEAAARRTRKIAIYDIHNNIIRAQGKNEFEDNELENNATFQELLANAKFLNGEINYTEAELYHIENKATDLGLLGTIGQLFETYILPNRPLNKVCCARGKPIATLLGLNTAAAAA